MLYLAFNASMFELKLNNRSTKYRFNGKELDAETGLYYYVNEHCNANICFTAKCNRLTSPQHSEDCIIGYYDPRISLWYGVDPMAEKYPSWSSFNYTLNNPTRFIDPTGMNEEDGDPDQKNKKTDPSLSKPIPQKQTEVKETNPYAPTLGKGSELAKRLPAVEDKLPFKMTDRPITGSDMVDFSDFIPNPKTITTFGIMLLGSFLVKEGAKESAELVLKNLPKALIPDKPLGEQLGKQLSSFSKQFKVPGQSAQKLLEMTPLQIEKHLANFPKAKDVYRQIKKAFQDGGHYYY